MRYTDTDLLNKLKNLAEKLGKSPSAKDALEAEDMPNVSTYRSRFGSWEKAKELAGLSTVTKFGKKTNEELIQSLVSFYEKHGVATKQKDCRSENGMCGPNTYKNRFGSWELALQAANLVKAERRSTQVDDKYLLDSLKRFYDENDYAPRHEDCNNLKEFTYLKCHMVYVRRFGSFSKALELAGVPLNEGNKSQAERNFVAALLSRLPKDINYVTSYKSENLGGLELDIFFPDLRVAFEFNGLYWHSVKNRPDKNYHLNKLKTCLDMGVKLVQIWEHEWAYKPEIVLNRCCAALGVYSERLNARDCSVRELSPLEAKLFLNSNHLQGSCASSIKLGLINKGNIVACMTFGKPRFTASYDYELIRFCTIGDKAVRGAASKLFSRFRTLVPNASVISYANRCWGEGGLYKALGFTLSHTTSPGYFYFKGRSVRSRYEFQKHKMESILEKFDASLTEEENAAMNGFYRVYDCGNAVFTLE